MDYEKKYKEAFERVKKLLSRCRNNRDRITMVYRVEDIESIFPELAESEDEKIKEDLIEWISDFPDMIWSGHYKKDVIAWLEKQGEQNPYSGVSFKYNGHTWGMCARDGGVEILIDRKLKAFISMDKSFFYPISSQSAVEAAKEEKVDNQNCVKSIYDVKPKFKVGDWISNDMCDVHIASIENGMYYFDEGDGLSIVFVDEHYHLWTIEDAMDGDVLVSRKPFIYGKQCPYGGLDWYNDKFIKASNFIFTDSPVHPATKEQRDLLFQKMKEARYTFDFKNKELKKIKNDIEIPFGAKDSELQEATYFIPKGFHAEIDNDKVVIKKGEKPTAWSEEDDAYKLFIISAVEDYYDEKNPLRKGLVDWLKSLKQRIGG